MLKQFSLISVKEMWKGGRFFTENKAMSGNISDNSRSGKYIVLAPIFGSLESGDREGKLNYPP